MKFVEDGGEEPFATALQSGADGAGKKLGILFGFKNGSAGAHVVTYADGPTLTVPTVDGEPTLVTRGDTAVATITRGETTTATGPDGQVVLEFLPGPGRAGHVRARPAPGHRRQRRAGRRDGRDQARRRLHHR